MIDVDYIKQQSKDLLLGTSEGLYLLSKEPNLIFRIKKPSMIQLRVAISEDPTIINSIGQLDYLTEVQLNELKLISS
ncbi:MAG: hypothetical protein DRG78_00260 [Epsilonproteobacteria bacterium]|nr:MAG: hypothetical protein DRG78_00260 [Campylobacterota bacterium]